MADLEKTVAIIFEGVDAMGSGVDSATKKVDGLAGSVESATQPLADATLGILKFEAALIAGGAAVTAFAVKLAGDFDSQFREISTLIDAPSEALEEFRGELLDYGRDSTQSLDQVNAAVYSAISAGADYTDSLELVRQSEQLAVAGRAGLAESNTLLVSSLNAYGESAEEAERYSDLLFQTVRSGQTTLPELAQALSQVTGVAAAGGVEFEELLAAVATLTATGAPTSQAVTQIRGAISAIIKPTSEAATLASELGIEFNAAALETQGLAGILESVAEATGGNTAEMAKLFGSVEALNGVLTLTGTGADKFSGTLEDMEGSAGATAEAYEKMVGDLESGSQRIQNALQGALIAVGDPLLDEFGGIQEAIAAIFNAIGQSIDGGQLEGFVDQLESMFGSIETTLRDVAANLPAALEAADFSGFFDGIDAIKTAVAGLFEGADLTSAEGLANVIEKIGTGFEFLAQYTAGAITALKPFLEQVAELAGWFMELDPAVFATVGTIGGLALAFNVLAGVTQNLTAVMRALLGSKGVMAQGAPIIKGLLGVLAGPLGLAVAAAGAATGIVTMSRDMLAANDAVDASRKANADLVEAIENGRVVWDYAADDYVAAADAQVTLEDKLRASQRALIDWTNSLGNTLTEQEKEARMMDEVNGKYANFEQQVEAAYRQSEGFRQEQEATTEALLAQVGALDPLGQGWEEVGNGIFQQVSNIGAFEDAYNDAKQALADGLITPEQFAQIEDALNAQKAGAEGAARAQGEIADAALTTEEAILAARDAVLAQELALEDLASNERIKSMEFIASIAVAELEADARKVEAILAATSQTITELGAVTNDMFGTLASDGLSFSQQWDLEDAIQQQLDIQREQADQQRELIDAEIQALRAKTERLRSGDGLIKIDSTGLEPALEMIMWEIIEKVQLRANAEGAEFLLGI